MKKFPILLTVAALSFAHADVTDLLKQGAEALSSSRSGD